MTMEIDADPHPSLVCATNGTSIQAPDVSAARSSFKLAARITRRAKMTRIFISLANGDYDQDQRHDSHQDNEQVAVADVARGKILLCLLRASRQLRQLIVAQLRNRILYLLRIDVDGFHRLPRLSGRKEIFDLRQIPLAGSRSGRDILLKIRRSNDMILCKRALRNCQNRGDEQHEKELEHAWNPHLHFSSRENGYGQAMAVYRLASPCVNCSCEFVLPFDL